MRHSWGTLSRAGLKSITIPTWEERSSEVAPIVEGATLTDGVTQTAIEAAPAAKEVAPMLVEVKTATIEGQEIEAAAAIDTVEEETDWWSV